MNTERLLRLEWIEVLLELFPDQARQAQESLDRSLTGRTDTQERCQIYRNAIDHWRNFLDGYTPHNRRYEREV